MNWEFSQSTFMWIFPVGRGMSAFLRTGLNHGFILDMGGDDTIDPANFIKKHFLEKLSPCKQTDREKISQAVLSHPHADHIRQCDQLAKGSLYPNLITCPNDKDPEETLDWSRIECHDDDNTITESYKQLYAHRNPPLQTIKNESDKSIPNLEYGIYYLTPPTCDTLHPSPSSNNDYGNCTSIVFYLRHGKHSVLFPGDITPEGMNHLLEEKTGAQKRFTRFSQTPGPAESMWHERTRDQPSLKSKLADHGLSILVAPHHGLESCYSEDLYGCIKDGKPSLVILSERRKRHENDGNTDARYQSETGAKGLDVVIDGEQDRGRRSLSTKDGHHILIIFSGDGNPLVYADKDPELLIKRLPYVK